MPRFAPVAQFLSEPLSLPINGVVYDIAPVDGETGLRLTARFEAVRKKAAPAAAGSGAEADTDADADEEVLDDVSEVQLYQMALGATYERMLADRVPYPTVKVAALTAVTWHVYGEKAAALYWAAGGDPKRTPSGSDSTSASETKATPAAARSTRKPGSASGTTRSRKPAKPKAPAGPTSSPSGGSSS